MELGRRWMVLLRFGRSRLCGNADMVERGACGEEGDVGRSRPEAGGGEVVKLRPKSEGLLCRPLGRDLVEVDMDVERVRYE